MIGSFYQPEAVFYDLNFLRSLPVREIRSGFAEIIKHALIADGSFFSWLRENIKALDRIPADLLKYALIKGIQIKGSIVSEDEKETGARAFLNFGHTLGHAIEAEKGYGDISHGEAVVTGMCFALHLSRNLTGLLFDSKEFSKWMEELGYETGIPDGLEARKLFERMKRDKKSVGQKVRFVLLEEIAKPVLVEVSDEWLLNSLNNFSGNQEECG